MSPYDGFETPGVSDPVEGAILGLRSLERSMALIARHVFRDADPEITELVSARNLHQAAISQWRHIHLQLLTVIGTSLHSPALNSMGAAPGIDGHGTRPVDVELQARAVRFLCESAFGPVPEYLASGVIADEANVSAEDVEDEIRAFRDKVFDHLTYAPRLRALPANWKTLKSGKGDFGAAEMLAELKPCLVR